MTQTYHHILKFSIKLLKLGGELLRGSKNRDVSAALQKQWTPPPRPKLQAEFTSHVWLSLLTAGLLIPIMMAKNEFRFLNSLQLRANTQARPSSSCDQVRAGGRASRHALVRDSPQRAGHLLCGYLDELLEELHSLTELAAQADLGDHPQLHLVEPAQEQVQVGRGSPEVLPAERVIQQLVLGRQRRKDYWRHWTVQRLQLHNDPSLITMLTFGLGGGGDLMHAAEEFPVKHGHLVGQILRAHQLKSGHGACGGALLVWKMSLTHKIFTVGKVVF